MWSGSRFTRSRVKLDLTLDLCLSVQNVTELIRLLVQSVFHTSGPLLSPVEKTVVLGVTSRSSDGLKGNAHSSDAQSSSSRSSRTDLGSPMADHRDSTTG